MGFDTHAEYQRLTAAKTDDERATAILETIKAATSASGQDAATKQDISGMKSELQALFHSEMLTQTRWLVTTVIAVAVVALTLSHFIH